MSSFHEHVIPVFLKRRWTYFSQTKKNKQANISILHLFILFFIYFYYYFILFIIYFIVCFILFLFFILFYFLFLFYRTFLFYASDILPLNVVFERSSPRAFKWGTTSYTFFKNHFKKYENQKVMSHTMFQSVQERKSHFTKPKSCHKSFGGGERYVRCFWAKKRPKTA